MAKKITGIDFKIKEMANRIKELREIEGISTMEMAEATDVSEKEYIKCESGKSNLTFAFLYSCAQVLGVDVTELIEGQKPVLRNFTVTRAGEGQRIGNAHGMTYFNMAYEFAGKICEPLYVKTAYVEGAENKDIELTTHEGQELDIVISGHLLVQVGEHRITLGKGDTIYLDSMTPHGMIAAGGEDCEFYAIVLNPSGKLMPEVDTDEIKIEDDSKKEKPKAKDKKKRIYQNFIDVKEDKNGTPTSIKFKNVENFNFAFDILDALAAKDPNKTAMVHISNDLEERILTFRDIKKASNQCANYFLSLGIKKGDKVLLIMKRHYQYWFAMLGLNKIGAIAIPASNQMLAHDLEYRFQAAEVSTVIASADGNITKEIDAAAKKCPTVKNKLIVNGEKKGWRSFDKEYITFSSHFHRSENSPGGDDLMLMFFTSGTSGFPKMAAHNYKYALGHFHTAKYWHCVDPDGLHLTISDTGWAKAMWGKLYGQWLCEAGIFVYDFDRFDAEKIMPMFAKYNITSFCAPPTMLRMMIKQDISKYDFSSIKHMTTAGEALNPEVYKQFEKLTGLQIREGYGQSESTMIIGNLIGRKHKVGSMGLPAPIYDVALLNAEGKPVDPGETGEICINIKNGSPCGLCVEYYKAPDKTAETWVDGYYHTGDTAWVDEDGYYWFVGRVDDIIKSSGYRIGPFEIESVIMELPYVLECGVSAAPDEIRGQVVKASIVLTEGTKPSQALIKEIQEYVKEHTAPYKYPRQVVFKKELPKTTSGKIIRNQL